MKSIRICAVLILCFMTQLSVGQNVRFPTEGTIEYNKSVNMFALIKKNIATYNDNFYQQAFDAYQKNQPQFKVLKSTLTFSIDKTLFKPIASKEAASGGFFSNEPSAKQNNTIYTDLGTGSSITQKNVYEELYLIKDSTRKITWKITDEMREIAGYNCRRANAIMLDSVYVVAFFTDQIPVSGGPESFSGLPGMILGVALPHENTTWFATKVTDTAIQPNVLVAPVKGKAVTLSQFTAEITKALKSWGSYAKSAIKAFML